MTNTHHILRRLHGSSYAAAVLVVVLMLSLSAAGRSVAVPDLESNGKYGPHFECYYHEEFGWPLACVRRDIDFNLIPSLGASSVYKTRVSSYGNLVVDGALIVLSAVLALVIFEVRRRRRRSVLDFRIADALIFMAVIALPLAVISTHMRARHMELQALSRPGILTYTQITMGKEREVPAVEWEYGGPFWLRQWISHPFWENFDRVVALDVRDDYRWSQLQLQEFRELKVLRTIRLAPVESDARPLPQLIALDLNWGTNATGEFDGIRLMPNLRAINLYDTAFSDEDVEVLRGLTQLEVLVLMETNVSDAGLAAVAQLPKLRWLDLSGRQITDEGIASLADLKNLKELNLYQTSVSADGIARLRRALPGCEIQAWK